MTDRGGEAISAKKTRLGIGFGLERIGLAVLRFPVSFTLAVVIVSLFAAWSVRNLGFDGDITTILPEDSQTYQTYFANKQDFRDFSRDITVVIKSDRLMTASGLEDLRSLQLETTIADFVDNTFTVFSAPKPDPETGKVGSFFPDEITSDAQARALVDTVVRDYPQAGALIAPASNTAIMLVTLNSGLQDSGKSTANFNKLRQVIKQAAPPDFKIFYTGLTPIATTIVGALVNDQVRLITIGLLLGGGIAFYVFRSLVAALICAIPPMFTILWSLALFALADKPVNYLTTVLPTLALILAFADGIVLYYRWQTSNADSDNLAANLKDSIRRVGPASALTSITTVLAFLSFAFASGSALKSFSLLGMSAVSIAFFAVITTLPLACHWAIRLGLVRKGGVRKPAFRRIGVHFVRIVSPRPVLIASLALIAVLCLSVLHSFVRAEYRVTDFLPYGSQTRQAEEIANKIAGGRSFIFLSVPAARPGAPFDPANLQRLGEAEAVARQVFSAERIFSLRTLVQGLKNETARAGLAREFEQAPAGEKDSYWSRDGKRMLVSIRIPSDQSIATTSRQINELRKGVDRLAYGGDVRITGFDVLMAKEFTHLINQLRISLLIAIFLGVAVIGVTTRSLFMTVIALTPNLLPIFSVELIVWLRGGTINMSEVIALTIAFGIAIDIAVHLINVYKTELDAGTEQVTAMNRAMEEVGAAMAASTAILCIATLVTQISDLPVVPSVGGLIIATLVVAYFSNLLILPANMLTLRRFFGRMERNKAKSAAGAE